MRGNNIQRLARVHIGQALLHRFIKSGFHIFKIQAVGIFKRIKSGLFRKTFTVGAFIAEDTVVNRCDQRQRFAFEIFYFNIVFHRPCGIDIKGRLNFGIRLFSLRDQGVVLRVVFFCGIIVFNCFLYRGGRLSCSVAVAARAVIARMITAGAIVARIVTASAVLTCTIAAGAGIIIAAGFIFTSAAIAAIGIGTADYVQIVFVVFLKAVVMVVSISAASKTARTLEIFSHVFFPFL